VIPPSIGKLAKLQVLDLSGNKLLDFPQTFCGKLIDLNLNGNNFNRANYKAWKFFMLPNIRLFLQNLNIGNNEVSPKSVLNDVLNTKFSMIASCSAIANIRSGKVDYAWTGWQ